MDSTRAVNDDAELLARIRTGAVDDFAEIVRRHQNRVFAILGRYERDPHRLQDLAQETFLKVWRALDQFDGRAPFEHWLARIAVRVALDHLRRQKRHRGEVALSELGQSGLEWLRQPNAPAEPDAQSAVELLQAAMDALSPADRVVLTLLELEDRSVNEVAALLGASSVAVRVRALRARQRLGRALKKLLAEAR